MDRRRFLQVTAPALALPALGRFGARAYGMGSGLASLAALADNDRVMVLVQLQGGNDGLNTVIPLDQYDNLAAARANILIPKDKILGLDANTGLHPALTGLQGLYKDGKVAIVQAVGYTPYNQSHFRSTDIWLSGSDANQVLDTGWMGRFLQGAYPGFPTGYPNAQFPDPPAIQIGSVISTGLQGDTAPVGISLTDPTSFYNLVQGTTDPVPDTPAGHELKFIRLVSQQTDKYGSTISAAAKKVTGTRSALYPPAADKNYLADQLKIVATLVAGGLKTRVYVVNLGGFDTHSAQVGATDIAGSGRHVILLDQLSKALAAFQDDLRLLGVEDRVLTMTMSEFGRRIRSNASLGTDHGMSAPHFVIAKGLKGGIYGKSPAIPNPATVNDNVQMQFDFRQLYATVLKEWFQLPDADARAALLKDFQPLGLAGPAALGPGAALRAGLGLEQNAPNPVRGATTIRFRLPASGAVSLKLYDSRGREARSLLEGPLGAGDHAAILDATGLRPGPYFYRLRAQGTTLQREMQVSD